MDQKIIRVCHLTNAHKKNDNRIFKKQCVSLANIGYDTYLIAQGDSELKDGVKIVGMGMPKNRLDRMTFFTRRIYKKALELNADIYELHDPTLLIYALLLKRKGKCVIFDSHENYSEQIIYKGYLPRITRKIIASLYHRFETFVCKRIDAVIFPCTQNNKNVFEGRSKRTVFINNTPILEELSISDNIQKFDKQYSICYVGNLTYKRGVMHLMEACYKADIRLILGGIFAPEEFAQKCMTSKAYECVDFRGFCNHDELNKIFSESVAGAATLLNVGQYNQYDNFPTKVYEYMASGLPAIVSRSQYADEMIKKYNFGISVNPESIDEIVGAINIIVNNPPLASEMGKNGKKLILEMFNWEIEEKKLLSLYESLIRSY